MSYRFKDARVQSGISQKDAAEQLQVSAATVTTGNPEEDFLRLMPWRKWQAYMAFLRTIYLAEQIPQILSAVLRNP